MQAQDCSLQNGGTALMVLVAFNLDPRRCWIPNRSRLPRLGQAREQSTTAATSVLRNWEDLVVVKHGPWESTNLYDAGCWHVARFSITGIGPNAAQHREK